MSTLIFRIGDCSTQRNLDDRGWKQARAIANEGVSSGESVLLKLNEDAPYEIVGRLNFGN